MAPVQAEPVFFETPGGRVAGARHRSGDGRSLVVLAHGAGGTMEAPGLVAFAAALAARGVEAVRFNFPYAEAGRKVPDPQPRLVAAYRSVAEQVRPTIGRLYVGGRSMGGRIASHLAAEGFPIDGLVFLAYPLHPPGQPRRLRTAHLGGIRAPMLFLQGSRDAFARLDLLRAAVEALAHARLHLLEGGDHGLSVRGRPPADVAAELAAVTAEWMASSDRRSLGIVETRPTPRFGPTSAQGTPAGLRGSAPVPQEGSAADEKLLGCNGGPAPPPRPGKHEAKRPGRTQAT